ncbi:hypothetical protein FCR2A7T_27460 [Flavobacterium cauense R2A-7]|uniref:PKD-like domain-containing protein n=5 Tax=Flavobacterium cauense TaxID=510946 RepID=UPI0003C5E23B|nr:PKD-like domain-containing protein [Flavobacterium cauense]ESU18459.1 hypothetical protein FCR2A7T_27460 [Flavobacterium cauense R2A-7]
MKNNYLFLFLFGFMSFFVKAQGPGNIGVNANSAASICNPGDCTNLTSTFFQTYQTTGYNVSSIPYNPPFGVTAGSATALTIDDQWSGIIDLKGITPQDFNFCFYNNSYVKCLVSTNGVITFSINGVVAGGLYSPNAFSTWVNSGAIPFSGPSGNAPFKNSINGVFQDTNPAVSNGFATPNINYYTTGVYPNRVFVVNVANVAQYGCSSDATVGAQTSQMMLYEGTNIIDVYVKRRYPCVSWSSGNGLIGVQNNAGTAGVTPAGRNGGTWITNNEAWRFTPNGVPIVPTFQWTDGSGNVVGNTQNISVCPTATTTYTVTATYPSCSPSVNYQVTDVVTVDLISIPTGTPVNLYQCNTGAATYTWDLSGNQTTAMAALDPGTYVPSLHTSLASAQGTDADLITGSITNYTTSGGTVTIWVAVEDLNTGCRNIQSFDLIVRNCNATPIQPPNLVLCDADGNGTESFDLTPQNTIILGGQNPANYNITYHTTLASADGTTPNSNLIPAGSLAAFISAGQTIYVRMEDATNPAVFGNTTFQLIVNPRPVISGTLSVCVGSTTQLSGTGSPSASNAWASSDTTVATVNSSGLVTGVASGTSTITYTDNNGCSNTTIVTVNPLPTVTVNSGSACQGGTVTLTATPGLAGTYNYVWTVPAGATNPGNVASFSTGIGGAYGVVITDTTTNCSSAIGSGTVTINPLPTVAVNSPSVCSGNAATVTATPGVAGSYNYSWTVPAGFANPGNVSTFTTTIAGNYSVVITNTITTCSSASASGTVSTNSLPTVTVNSPVTCAGNSVTVTATPGAAGTYNYAWTVPAGATNPGNVATFSTSIAGTYSVVITNTATTCSSASASGTVTINPLPTVTVNSSSVCAGGTATVTATPGTAGTYTYVWTVPAGVTNPGNVASFTTTILGTYSVVITDTTTSCSSASASGTVTASPSGGSMNLQCGPYNNNPTYPNSIYIDWSNVPGITTFNYSYSINGGPVVTGSQNSPSSIYIVTNGMPITFTLSGVGSVCVPTETITCGCPAPIINAVPNVSLCSGQSVSQLNFTTSDAYDSVSWTNSNPAIGLPASGSTFFLPSFTAQTVSTPQTATITVTLTKYGCNGPTRTFTVTVNPLPEVTVNSPVVCAGTPATVTATPLTTGTFTYAWTVPAGATNPGNVASFTTTTAGNYSVIITNTTTTCSSVSASGTVTVNPLPTVTVNSSTVCTGALATVTATPGTPGTYNYAWTVPAGVTNPGNVASFTTATVGTYSVVITNTTTNCSSLSASGTVSNYAVPTVTVNSPSICTGGTATVTATPGIAGTYTYVWTVPAGVTNPGNVASFTTTTAGNYSVVITNTTTTCSSASASGTVTVNALPTVTVNSPAVCAGTAATVTATPGTAATYTYVWTVPAGATNPGNVASFTTTTAGNYSVIITNTTTTCSSVSASGTVTVNPLPAVTVNSSTVCTGALATVTATPGTLGTYNYAWTVPAGVTNPGNVASFTTATVGTYSVVITNTTTNCSSLSASGTVSNHAVPTVTVNSPSICTGGTATVTATPGIAGTYTYVWTVPAGVTNPGNVASFTTTTAGNYSVVITNTTTTCSSASASGTVTVNALPTVTVNSPAVCAGTAATVTATPGIAGTYTYVWTVPAGATNPGNVASFTTTTAGNYSVIITNTTTTCSSVSVSGTVTVNPLPTVTVNSSTVCTGALATVTATPGTPGTYNYAWTVPTGVTNPGNVASFTTATVGTYSVVITNTTTSCSSLSASGTVSNYAVPTVTVNNPSICSGASTTVTATPGIAGSYTYSWTVPTGVTNPGNVASFVTSTPGAYSVVITNTTNSCSSALATGNVTLNQTPTVIATPTSQSLCSGQSTGIQLQSNVANATFTWTYTQTGGVTGASNGSGNIISQVLTAGTTTGTVTYTITPTSAGSCTGIPISVTITVTPVPVVNLNVTSQSICTGQTTNITMTSTIATTTFGWNVVQSGGVTGGTNGTGTAITDVLTASGNTIGQAIYTITPINNGCPGTPKTVMVTVYPKPIVTASPTSAILCSGQTTNITLTSTVPGTVFNWTVVQTGVFGAASGTGSTISQTLSTVGLVQGTVTYTITPVVNGCSGDPVTVTVTVNPTPEVFSSSAPQFICSGVSPGITVFPNIPGTSITWTVVQTNVTGASDGSGSETTPGAGISINQVLTATGNIQGTVIYTIIPINNGCSGAPITVEVKVNPLPNPQIADGVICVDAITGSLIYGYEMDTQLSDTDYDFQWYFGSDLTTIIGTNSSYTATQAGQYTVSIMNMITGCTNVAIIDVTASNPALGATAMVSNYFQDDQTITVIVNGNGIYEYELDHSGIWQTSNIFPHVLPGEHTVAIRDAKGCTDIVLEHIWTIGYPHFFTPNGDGYNDTWNIWSLEKDQPNAEIHIFDRYGKLVKQIVPSGTGWDGTFNGQLLPSTDYWFTVKYMENGAEKIFKAHFSMKR